MFPVILQIGTVSIHSFGVFVALGFAAGIWWSVREGGRIGLPRERVLDLTFWLLVSGVIGARLLFVAINWQDFFVHTAAQIEEHGNATGILRGLLEAAAVWKGGIVWYGGLLAAFAVGVWYMRRTNLPVWKTSDAVAPGVMLGLAFGRIGCLAAGDDYGKVVESAWETVRTGGNAPWWTLTFTDPQSLVPQEMLGMPLYPAQILMSLNALLIFAVLVWLRRVKTFEGQVTWSMMLLYSVGRFFVEYSRGDAGRGFVVDPWLSTSQFISVLTFALAAVMYARCKRGASTSAPAA